MKKLIFLLFILIGFTANAQNAQDIIDGLKKDLKANPDDKKRATIYSDLTWYYSNISLDSAMSYGKKAIIESTKLKDSTLIAQVYSDLGAVYFGKGDFINSKRNYLKSYKIRKAQNDINGLIKINANLGSIYTSVQDYEMAVKSYLETLKYYELQKKDSLASIIKSNLGTVFLEMNNFPKAYLFATEAKVFQEKNKMYFRLANTYLLLGNYFIKTNDTSQGYQYYEKTYELGKKIKNNLVISSACQSLGEINSVLGKSNKAILYFNESKRILTELKSENEIAFLDVNLGIEYIVSKNYITAKKYLLSSKKFFENDFDHKELIDVYKQLAIVNGFLKQPDSVVIYLEKYSVQKNKLAQIDISKQTAELETKYQTTKKEKQIIQQRAEAKQKNLYLLGLAVLSILVGLIGFLIYKQQRQKNQQIVQENELKSAIAVIENQNKLQEQRLSISRDLHDNIGSQLTFIISSVDNVKYGFNIDNPKLDNKLTNISSFAKDTILELRDTIWAMNSNEISYEDLEVRINNFIEKAKLSQENISFSFAIDENLKSKKLTSVEGMNVYRTIQEAINNALKYAQADIIAVNIKQQANQTAINIKDNGKGFDESTIEKGNGLNNMKKRIEEIGGNFNISSNNEGTKIVILI